MPEPDKLDIGSDPVEPVPVADDEKIFDDAFKEAAVSLEAPPDLSAGDNPENVKDEKVEEVPIVEEKKEEPPPPPAPAAPVTDPSLQQPGESDEKYEQRYKTLQGIHKHDKETWEAERTKLLSDLEEARKPKPPESPSTQEAAAVQDFIDSLTPEQQEKLKAYQTDFETVSEMEGLLRKVELGKLRKEILADFQKMKEDLSTQLTEVKTTVDTRIAPAVKLAEESERELHFSTIRDGYVREDGTAVPGHSDFEKYRDDGSLLSWIESKPRYLQPALKATYEGGTALDVIDLLSDFKRDNNIPITPQPSSDNVIPISPAKAAKKQALTTVTTRRGAVNTAVAPSDDFDSAFEEAMHK